MPITPAQKKWRSTDSGKKNKKKWRTFAKRTPAGRARRAAASNRRRDRVRQAIRDIKSKPCMDCGGVFDPVCMDFDHRPGEDKVANVSFLAIQSIGATMREIAKCDIVCSNCHRIRTLRRRNHGDSVRRARRDRQPNSQLLLFDGAESGHLTAVQTKAAVQPVVVMAWPEEHW